VTPNLKNRSAFIRGRGAEKPGGEQMIMFEETEIGRIRRNMIALMRRSAIDRDFRALCLENGAKAYLELSGEPLPEKYKVRFAEQDDAGPGGMPQAGGPPREPEVCRPQVCLLPQFLPPTWLE
jgi:hypothetical protein